MARLLTIPPQKRREIDFDIVDKIKTEMFPNRTFEMGWGSRIDWVEFGLIDAGRRHENRFAGLQMKLYAGSTVIRKVMVKDGKIDIDKCLARFEELKEIKRETEESNRRVKAQQDELSADVDQFIQDMAPMPPGFVIRTYGEGQWIVKYEANGLTRDRAATIVKAVREALKEDVS